MDQRVPLIYTFAISVIMLLTVSITACRAEKPEDSPMFIKPPTKIYVITSPLSGKLVQAGTPLKNTKLIRNIEWNGNKEGSKEEIFYTDENGVFNLPVFEIEMAMRGLEQFVAKTKIYVEKEGEEKELIWYSPKMREELYTETEGPVAGLVCDLNASKIVTQETSNPILTSCRWDNMPEFSEYVEY